MQKILYITLITLCTTLSTIPTFKSPQKYIQIGSRFFHFTPSLLNNHSIGNNQYTFTISLSQAKSQQYNCHANIQGINYHFSPQRQLGFGIRNISKDSNSSLSLMLYTIATNSLLAISIRYIVVLKPFNKILLTSQFFEKDIPLVISQGRWTGSIQTSINAYQNQEYSFFLNGISIKLLNSQRLDIAIFPFVGRNKMVVVNVEITNIQKVIINQIIVSSYLYNKTNFESQYHFEYRITSINIKVIDSETTFYNNTNNPMNSLNTLWGLTKFSTTNQSLLIFSTDLQNGQIKVGSRLSFNNIEVKAIIIQVKQCDLLSPYYLISADTCYDQCPDRYTKDSSQRQCKKCQLHDCLNCDNTNNACSKCSSEEDFRILNIDTNRCDPMPGYYDDGKNNSIAKPCNSNCQTCAQIPTKCTSCNVAFVLNGDSNQCEKCPANCIKCTSRVVCTTCKTDYALNNGQCTHTMPTKDMPSSYMVVASATTSLFSCCTLVSIFVFIKQKRQWPTLEEKQQKYSQDKNGLQKQRKNSQWSSKQQTLRQLPSNKSIKLIVNENQTINLRDICEIKLDDKYLIK